MKAIAIKDYQGIKKEATADFVEDDGWKGARVGRKKPYGYFPFKAGDKIKKLSTHLVQESGCFDINDN